ncbi:uncharacterized protein LOC133976775 [Scomber scombrus]|uniref:uncharacterized protein LOC133976775 n=1 Tax=Scomber scombrus TaxID=13677 RepID=UPI002DD81E69|nr:uncharacterized protein LOC133976775 [Scomber scombrus]
MSKHQVTSKQAPATEEEMAVTPDDLSSKVYGEDDDDDDDDAAAEDGGPTVTSKQAPATEEEMAVTPDDLSSKVYGEDDDDDDDDAAAEDGGPTVTSKQAPATEEEMAVTPDDLSSKVYGEDDDDDDDDAAAEDGGPTVTSKQAPATEEEMAVTPDDLSSKVYGEDDDDDDDDAAAEDGGPTVTSKQAPATEEEMAVTPDDLSSKVYGEDDDDDDDDAAAEDGGPTVTSKQAPATEEEMAVTPDDLSSKVYGEDDDDDDDDAAAEDGGPTVTSKQAPATEEEMAVTPDDLSSKVYGEDDDDDDDDAAAEDGGPTEFAIRGSSLVDYSDTDGTDVDCLNDQPLAPRCDEGVPKLRRTKSIWMKKVPDFSDALYDSDDSTEGPSAQSKSEMALQRMHTLEDFCQRVNDSDESIVEETDYEDSIKDDSNEQSDIEVVPKLRTKTIQMQGILAVSDASSGEEYIPGPESTDSDSSLEIPMANNKDNRLKSSSKSHSESSWKSQSKSSSQSSFKTNDAPPGFSDAYWKFLNNMNQDKIAIAVKKDRFILEYGYRLFKKNERVISQHQYVRQKLRELGRLMLAAKKVAPVNTIKELIKPENYSHVVTAARCLAGFNDETGKYKCPSLARKVGHSLLALAMFKKSEGLKARDKGTVQDAEEFAQLYQESWKFDIASQALIQLNQSKWNSPQLLPFTQDVQSLHSQLSEKQQQHLHALKEEASPSNWKDLSKVTLAQVILFNRRREGEVSKMPLSVYMSRDLSETHEDINLALTELEQKLCKHFVRITIVGKRGRKVPVLLTPLMKECLDTLVERRAECGVLTENGFLFALPHSVHHLRGSDCIRQLVHECSGIKNPRALTSTKLRKHIATLSTVLNLKNTELDQLADFLGHNIDVHRKHYRLPEGTLQLAKISKVLLALEQGKLGKYKGKSLDEIHIDPNEAVEIEACSQEDIEDASMADQGSEDETITTPPCKNASTPEESDDEDSTTSLQQIPSKKRGKRTVVKKSWTTEESGAVERHLKKQIIMNQVPGKEECERCITAEPQALKNRDWRAVKYYVKNRITSLRRKLE